jgi:hypothetical protein
MSRSKGKSEANERFGNDNGRNNRDQNRRPQIPEEVKSFATWTRESYHKRVKGTYSKKEEKQYFWEDKLICLGPTIDFLCRFGNNPDEKVQEIKNLTYAQFVDRDMKLVKRLIKVIKNGDGDMIENLIYLPILLREILTDSTKFNNNLPDGEEPVPLESLCELAELILKKKIKKLTKKDIPENLAFDILLVMPEKDALKYGRYSRAKQIFDTLYMYGENNTAVDVPALFKALVDVNDYQILIGFALQERKEKTKGFNDIQMKFFVDVNEWIFDTMEDMSDSEIRSILNNYIRIRKKDAAAGKDGNRRYFLSSLPESDYPTVSRIIMDLKKNPENEKYL